jgi:hypothetical protein
MYPLVLVRLWILPCMTRLISLISYCRVISSVLYVQHQTQFYLYYVQFGIHYVIHYVHLFVSIILLLFVSVNPPTERFAQACFVFMHVR